MAEDSRFWTTNNTGDGPTAGYTAANMQQFIRETFITDNTAEGVLYGILNSLAVSGTSSPVAVASGAALVYGFYYSNTASVNVTIPTPATNPRIDRIVLRVSWAAQTVRITRIAGTEAASPSAPSMTQVANTTWDIPLATVQITTGGVITVTDARTFVKHPGVYGWLNANIQVNGNIIASKSNSGSYNEIAVKNTSNTAGSYARLLSQVGGGSADDPLLVWEIVGAGAWSMGLDNSDSDKLKIAPYSVIGSGDVLTLTSAGALSALASITAPIHYVDSTFLHQVSGGNAITNFDTSDYILYDRTNNIFCFYVGGVLKATIDSSGLFSGALNASQLGTGTVPAARITAVSADSIDDTMVGNRVPQFYRRQGGSATDWSSAGTSTQTPTTVRMQAGSFTVPASSSPSTVTFPVAFSNAPLVVATSQSDGVFTTVQSVGASSFGVLARAYSGSYPGAVVNWIAIGPE